MCRFLILVIVLFSFGFSQNLSSINRKVGDNTTGFWLKGTISFSGNCCRYGGTKGLEHYCYDTANVGTGSFMPRWGGLPSFYVVTQAVSDNPNINGKINDKFMLLPYGPNCDSIDNITGRYAVWVNLAGFYNTTDPKFGKIPIVYGSGINCEANVIKTITDSNPTFASLVKDVRLSSIKIRLTETNVVGKPEFISIYWTDIYTKSENFNTVTKKYNDITGYDFLMDYNNGTITIKNPSKSKSNCSDSLPNIHRVTTSAINPIIRNCGKSNDVLGSRNVLLNGKILNRTNYLSKWNRIVSEKGYTHIN